MDNQLDKVQTDNQQTKEKNDHTDQNTSLENNHTDQNTSLENNHTDQNISLENDHTDQNTSLENDHTDQNISLENDHTDQNISLENDHTDQNISLENNHTDQNISLENDHTDQNISLENNHTDQNTSPDNDHTDQNTSLEYYHTDQNTSLEYYHTDQNTSLENYHTDHNTSLENYHTDHNTSLENDHTDQNTSLENDHTDHNTSLENYHTHHNTSMENNHTDQNTTLEYYHTDHNTSLENYHTDHNTSLENDHTDHNTSLENYHTDHNTSLENYHTDQNTTLEINNFKDETLTKTQETSLSGTKRITVSLGAAAFFSALGTSFLCGYSLSSVNAPALYVQDFYNKTWMERYGEPLGEERTTLLWSITVSIYSIGGIIGAVIIPMLANILGRKGTLLLNNVFALAAAVLMGACEKAGSFEMMIIGRLVMGLNAGVGLNINSMYLAEISPRHIRGSIGQMNSILISCGIFIGQVWGLPEVLGQESRWSLMFAFMAVPALLQLSVLPFLPESPRFLLIQRKDEAGAERAFRRFLGKEDVSQEMAEVHAESLVQRNMKVMSVLELLRDPAVRWQIITISVLMTCLRLCGVPALFFYTNVILQNAGIASNLITYIVLSTGGIAIVSSIISSIVIERVGRRLLLLIGFGGMAVGYALLTVFLNVQDRATWIPYLSFISILAVLALFSFGPAGVAFIVNSELFEQSYRPTAFMIGGVLAWLSNFILGLVFPYIQEALQTYVFLVFMVICLLCTIYLFIILPETKNKTFVEISHSFAKRNKIPVPAADLESNPESKVDGEAGHGVNGQTPVTSV